MEQTGVRPTRLRGILARMAVLLLVAVAAPMTLFGWIGWRGLDEMRGRLTEERRGVAIAVARQLDGTMREPMQLLAAMPDTAMREVWQPSHLFERIFLVDSHGEVLRAEPSSGPGLDLAAIPELGKALRSGRPSFSAVRTGADGQHRVFAIVPLPGDSGEVALAVGAWNLEAPRTIDRLETTWLARGASLDLVGESGEVLLSSVPSRRFLPSDHATTLAGWVAEKRSGFAVRASPAGLECIAAAPLRVAPWAVVVREPAASLFAPVERVRRSLLAVGVCVLAIAGLFAWGVSRSVRIPLLRLTEAAERIAAGDLEAPIRATGDDELGRLGRSFETMRQHLQVSMHRITRANEEMELRIEERTRTLQRLLRKVIGAQEDERKRIARELHDETCQTITALSLSVLGALTASSPEAARERLSEAGGMAARTLDELHRVMFDLRPAMLDDLGLVAAIRGYAQRHLPAAGVAPRFEIDDRELRLAPEIETALFRAAQEALNNVLRHAEAESVRIRVGVRDGFLEIEIEDDGRGFEPSEIAGPAESGRGLGVLGMRERLELIGGTATVDSAPGRGTRVLLRVAIPEEKQVA